MLRPQRFCIFCGGPGLTKEHVWADWLKKYIPKTAVEYTAFSATLHETHSEFRRKKVAGDLRSRRLRIVCRNCNNGWMAKLQERAKPYLLPLILGEVTAFDAKIQQILAAWVAMFVMVAEHFDPTKVTTAQDEREYFRTHLKPPPNWKIWIGDYERGNWPALLAHFAVPISSPDHPPEIMSDGTRRRLLRSRDSRKQRPPPAPAATGS